MKIDTDKKRLVLSVVFVGLLVGGWLGTELVLLEAMRPRTIPYSELVQLVHDQKVREVEIGSSEIVAALRPGKDATPSPLGASPLVRATRLPGVDASDLVKELDAQHVVYAGRIEQVPWWQHVLSWVAPALILLAPYWWSMRRLGRGGPLSLGRNQPKVHDAARQERVTFADVAGVDEAKQELVEIVDYLKEPAKYASIGARVPKGVLLIGPPGTGKTLLAKAVACEAGVPFFAFPASSFVEMFVGLGAARVRDLFAQAKSRAPCIVFIDELDAVGKSRSSVAAVAHEDREQTLDQLLVEMDGFEPNSGVLLMAATNRPEVLDRALLRAGRFDRQVLVDRPDVRGREAILRVHARRVQVGPSVDFSLIARRTPGMVGADLANVVNEAALAAARRRSRSVEQQDFEEALDRVQLGLAKRGTLLSAEEKRRIAYHEAGHALVALAMDHADPVHRVTILPRTIGALGVTLQLPTSDKHLLTRQELEDRICVMLGGRTAEQIACGDVSTGAENDLERATETARQMVCRFGMSEALGPATFGRRHAAPWLGDLGAEERTYSEQTAVRIDAEVRRILDEQLARARDVLERRRRHLDAIAEALVERETLEREDLEALCAAGSEARRTAA